LGVWELAFVTFDVLFFFELLTSFTLGGHNFIISNSFSTIVNVLNSSRRKVQVLFGHEKQQSLPLLFGLPLALNA
jgi:hypothetical protein